MFLMITTIPADVEIQRRLTSVHIDEWFREDIFRFKWWFLLFFILVSLLLWWIMLDKSRLHEIFLYTVLATILALGIHEYGEELTLWEYPTDLLPIFPPLSSINLISLPLLYSLTYQYFKTWKSFISAGIIITAVICFIIEPLLALGKFYELLKWKYYYSFPLYLAVAIGVRAITTKILAVTQENRIKK